jgi:hypothetical protein
MPDELLKKVKQLLEKADENTEWQIVKSK